MSTQELIRKEEQALQQTAKKTLLETLAKYQTSIAKVLGKQIDTERFGRLVVGAIRTNPRLLECTPASFINCVMHATALRLEIMPRSAYLVPFGTECTLLIDYRGKMELARRSGKVGVIKPGMVREFDRFEFEETERGAKFIHEPKVLLREGQTLRRVTSEDVGGPVLVYAYAGLKGFEERQLAVLTFAHIEKVRKRSRSGKGDLSYEDICELMAKAGGDPWKLGYKQRVPWVTDWDAMALKTAVHALCNLLPQEEEIRISQDIDDDHDAGKMPVPLIEFDPDDEFEPIMPKGSVQAAQEVAQKKLAEIEHIAEQESPEDYGIESVGAGKGKE